jgi:iron complex outermembrane receptor protein
MGARALGKTSSYPNGYRPLLRSMMTAHAFALLLSFAAMSMKSAAQTATSSTPPPGDLINLSLEQLGNIVVTTASKEPEEVWQSPTAIYVITQEDIRRSGATTIPELLRLAPGVEVARIDSDHWAVGIRGFGGEFSKSLLVLIDGRSVYSPLFAGVYWQVQDTLFEDIDRIEIIRGPGGTIWGANAVNGIINIITKSAKSTHGNLNSLGGGNIDQGIGAARFGSTVGKGFDYRVYGKGFIRSHESHPDGANFDEWRMGQLGFRTDWAATPRDAIILQGDIYLGRDGERVAVSTYSPPSTMVIDAPHSTSGGNLVGSWRRQIDSASDIEVHGYFDRTTRYSPQLNEIRNTFDIDVLYHLTVKAHNDFILGAGARWSPDTVTQKFATLNFAPSRETDSIYSWFAQDQIKLAPKKLSLLLGSKFEHNNRSGFEVQPNGRLLWTPGAHQTVWAAVARAVRTPSRLDQDLQLTDFLQANPPAFLRVVGSKNFRSEQMLGTEVGYRALLSSTLYIDIAAFRNDYNDLYGYAPGAIFMEASPSPAHLILQEPLANALKGHTSGGEITPEWKPVTWWQIKGSYSYLHLYVHDKPGFTDNQNTVSDNGSSPHHQFTVQSFLNLPKRIEIDATYRYVSSLPAQKIKAYKTGDFRVGWRPSNNWDLSVIGRNIMQGQHAEFGSDVNTIVGIKRNIYARITWTSSR